MVNMYKFFKKDCNGLFSNMKMPEKPQKKTKLDDCRSKYKNNCNTTGVA